MSPWCGRFCACLLALACLGCGRSHFNLATQRQELTFTSTDREVEQGRKLARRILRELPLVADETVQQRIRGIGQRIAAVCDRRELVYQFYAVAEEDVNAFSLPGGHVFINEGLIKKAANDDELASVIAHEVAHITARHSVKRFESGLGLQLLQLASLAIRQTQAMQGVGIASQAARLAYAREDELQADRLGVKYMKAAGFDPKAALAFLQTLQAVSADDSHYLPRGIVRPQYALTHPFVPERMRTVKEALYGVADYIDYLNSPQ